jgi:hypothetical protein
MFQSHTVIFKGRPMSKVRMILHELLELELIVKYH